MKQNQNKITDWVREHKQTIISILWGVLLLGVSLIINYAAGTYATIRAGNAVQDIILDHIPAMDVSFAFTYGVILFFVFTAFMAAKNPKKLPFILKSLSLFIIIRSFFIVLTHIGPLPYASDIPEMIDNFTFKGDLFFSAHVGMPFLMALIFWEERYLRYIFCVLSVFFGVVVLLGHLHYSIDVFAAYFITYGIFHISTRFFKKDFALLVSHYSKKDRDNG